MRAFQRHLPSSRVSALIMQGGFPRRIRCRTLPLVSYRGRSAGRGGGACNANWVLDAGPSC